MYHAILLLLRYFYRSKHFWILYSNPRTNFHDRVADDCLKESIKGTTGEIHFIGFFETFKLVMPAFVCRGSSRILSPAIKPRYKSKGYECNDTSGTKGSSYLASRACTRVSRVCVYTGWFKNSSWNESVRKEKKKYY